MDGYDLFRKLSAGAKFDFKRFRSDAEKLHIIRPKQKGSNEKDEAKSKKTVHLKAKVNAKAEEDDSDSDNSENDFKNTMKKSEPEMSDSDEEMDDSEDDSEKDKADDDDDDEEEEDEKSDDPENNLNILGDIKYADAKDKNQRKEEKKKRKLERMKSEQLQAELKQEEINHIRKKHRVHTHGTDIPDPIESFEGLQTKYKINKHIIRNIEAVGYKTPTPIQVQAVPVMLENRDILACAPTGSGKTAAFILPILHHLKEPRNEGVRALVLAPTRELAKQTYREFQRLSDKMGFRLAYIDKVGKDFERLKKTFRKSDIMVSTPNRLVYLLEQSPPLVSLTSVKWLVVDESDKLFEDGKTGFRDQLATIYKSCDGSVRRAMFSATFTYDVEQWCKLNLDNVVQVYIGAKNTATRTVEQKLLFCGSEHGKLVAMRGIIKEGIEPPVLVFVQSKDRAKELFHELIYDGMNVDVIHAERTQKQRDNVVKCFRSGKIWILICTELMGRGIDFKGVNLVINYDFPNSTISYIHRIGRTGRAGRPGKAITFFTENDAVFLRSIAGVMRSAGCPVPDYMLKMNKPCKKTRKKLAKFSINRDAISTAPRHRALYRAKSKKKGEQSDVKAKKTAEFQKKLSSWLPADKKNKWKKKKRKGGEDVESSSPKKQKIDSDNMTGTNAHNKTKSHKQFKSKSSFKDKKSVKGDMKNNTEM